MNDPLFGSIVLTGLTVSFLHSALPTHWLPFVLAGRRQRWSRNKTLGIAALAGSGHVLFTIALGVAVAWFGIALDRWTGGVFPFIAAGILIGFGVYFLTRQGHGHTHFGGHSHDHGHPHDHADHDHAHDQDHTHDHDHGHAHDHGHVHGHPHARDHANGAPYDEAEVETAVALVDTLAPNASDRAVIIGLLAALTLSPCEGFLPVFVAGVKFGWTGFAALCAVLAVATLGGMLLLTWLTLVGLPHARFDRFERYESKVLGGLLILLGIAVLILES
jgi:nickel/cobalt exporter